MSKKVGQIAMKIVCQISLNLTPDSKDGHVKTSEKRPFVTHFANILKMAK